MCFSIELEPGIACARTVQTTKPDNAETMRSTKDVRKMAVFESPVRKCPTWLTRTPIPCGRPQVRGRGWPTYAYITLTSSVSQVLPECI